MIMQTLRSRSSSSSMVLPRTIDDVKVTSPPSSGPSPVVSKRKSHSPRPSNGTHHHNKYFSPYNSREEKSPRKRGSWFCSFLGLLVFAGIAAGAFVAGGKLSRDEMIFQINELEITKAEMVRDQERLEAELEDARAKAKVIANQPTPKPDKELQGRLETLTLQVQNLEVQVQQERDATLNAKHDIEVAQSRVMDVEKKMKDDIQELETKIKTISKAQAVEAFGPGPHYAEFQLHVAGQGEMRFTIELVSLEKMPATVNAFLQQVKKRLWDGTSIYLNAEHVMMTRPVSWDGTVTRRPEFGILDQVQLIEYDKDFPHLPYTLGLNGNPPGPDFYINKVDNTLPHGPKGRQHAGTAEPCFGRVIIGKEIIDKISSLPGKTDQPRMLRRPVEIVSVRVLRSLEEAIGGREYVALMNAKSK